MLLNGRQQDCINARVQSTSILSITGFVSRSSKNFFFTFKNNSRQYDMNSTLYDEINSNKGNAGRSPGAEGRMKV